MGWYNHLYYLKLQSYQKTAQSLVNTSFSFSWNSRLPQQQYDQLKTFLIPFTSITIGAHQKETKRKGLVQHTSEGSNRLWKTTLGGELFMEFCREACRESREGSSNLCSWCPYNRWVGPETERIPQPVPDPNNSEHFVDVYPTNLIGRTPDDYLPRKCVKDLWWWTFWQYYIRLRYHQELLHKI